MSQSQITNVPLTQEACCSVLAKAYGRIVREGGALSREINKEERINLGYGTENLNILNYNERLAAIQYFQLVTLQIAAGALSCDGINSKCCEGYAEGLTEAFLGILEQTIHNVYQTSFGIGDGPINQTPENPLGTIPFPQLPGTVWYNVAVALGAAQTLFENLAQITGSSCGSSEQ